MKNLRNPTKFSPSATVDTVCTSGGTYAAKSKGGGGNQCKSGGGGNGKCGGKCK